MRLAGTVSLVTGAGRGIGKAIALKLAAEGSTVVLAARTVPELDAVKSEILAMGGKARSIPTDVTSADSITNLFNLLEKEFGRLDILINNAGIGVFAPALELTLADFETMWNVNVRGVFLCSQRAAAMMTKQRSGAIVNIDSLAGKNSFVGGAGYAATKWALKGFSDCLRLEVREHNVRVISIFPGSVSTQFHPTTGDAARAHKLIQPDDVADAVLMAVTMPERTMVSEIDIRPTNPK